MLDSVHGTKYLRQSLEEYNIIWLDEHSICVEEGPLDTNIHILL